jgi:ABC-2 type transport system ATP-binding protein
MELVDNQQIASEQKVAISARDLRKKFGKTQVLRGIDLEVPQGQITGLVGPSGHGKTTLVNLIVGALKPTSGELTVLGEPAPPRAALQQIGFMPQAEALYDDLTGRQNLSFFGAIYGLNNAELATAIDETLQAVSLPDEPSKLVRDYSGGMKRRLSLAISLLHRPKLLVLDEPTVGLDPAHRVKLWELFRSLAANGTTALITTHVMSEAATCDQIVMIYDGLVIAQGSPSELLAETKTTDLEQAFLFFENRAMSQETSVQGSIDHA